MSSTSDQPLDPRARQLLRTLIAQYLEEGQPIGSRTLSRSAGLDVSPATVRNIMSDLEELGLVASPHTSAGRVPTARGLRVFVDSLLELKPLPRGAVMQIQRELPRDSVSPRELLGSASTLLSAMTRFVGLVTVPGAVDAAVKQIEFVSIDTRRVLAILVFADGQVQNRVLNLTRRFDGDALAQAANYLNAHYAGLQLDEIRIRVLADLRAASSELNRLLASAVEVAAETFAPEPESDMLVSGQTNLMSGEEASQIDRLRELFEAFQRKRELLALLEGCARSPGVRLFIGEESGFEPLAGYSLVSAPYGAEGHVLGAIGVIGPTRMAYHSVIPVVQATAHLLTDALNRGPLTT
ncbi:MAG TPA: heat-inducible transcriptional repressor HrcA [Rhodanobacteraceae bacterium]|jgi:heat-inducible transcriptional repressor|nr:heat-inducible transcriptional repressor HrcA [Rhodanobacteraceae bacterium]